MPVFQYHCGIENDEFVKPEQQRKADFQKACDRLVAPRLPSGVSVTITRWDQHHRGDFFHDRYILTDKGGIRLGWGLDRSKRPEETTDVTLLDAGLWSECWQNFQTHSIVYRHIDSIEVKGIR